MQDSCLSKTADEIQSFADRKDMKMFFDARKTVYGPQSSGTSPLLSADGTNLLTDTEAILKRWAEQFDSVLNRPSSIYDETINRLPQVECYPQLSEFQTVSKTVKAIKLMSSGKDQMQYMQGFTNRRSSSYEKSAICAETELFRIRWNYGGQKKRYKRTSQSHF